MSKLMERALNERIVIAGIAVSGVGWLTKGLMMNAVDWTVRTWELARKNPEFDPFGLFFIVVFILTAYLGVAVHAKRDAERNAQRKVTRYNG